MGQHFLYHQELVASTAVHHAVHAKLTNDEQPDLVLCSPQSLKIYRIESFPNNSSAKGQVLHLLASFPLAGTIESIQILHYDTKFLQKKSHPFHIGKDILLLSFAHFKWVLAAFDRKTRSLITLAMYTFEENAIGPGATLKGERNNREQMLGLSCQPIIKTDALGRCGAMLIYQDQLVIVPFRTSSMDLFFFDEEEEDEGFEDGTSGTKEDDNTSDLDASADEEEEEEEEEEEKELKELVEESKQMGHNKSKTNEVDSRLKRLLDKSVKVGTKRKRHHKGAGLLSTELAGREFLLRLKELNIYGKIVDMAFLEGYLEPTLMILHETNDQASSTGRAAAGNDTFCLTVLSINLNTRLHPKIWSVQNVPSDAFMLIPCRAVIGGALVVTPHAVLYFNQTQFCGVGTNNFAHLTVNQSVYPLPEVSTSQINALFYDCVYEYLTDYEVIFFLPDGESYVLTLPRSSKSKRKSSDKSKALVLSRVNSLEGRKALASCICHVEEKKTLFVGSRSGDSMLYTYSTNLVKVQKVIPSTKDQSMELNGDENGEQTEEEDQELEDEEDEEMEEEEEEDEEEMFLYGSSKQWDYLSNRNSLDTAKLHHEDNNSIDFVPEGMRRNYAFRIVDALPSIGQITSVEVGIESSADANEKREELLVSGGHLEHGAVSSLHHGLRPIVSTEAELSGCRAMWTVSAPSFLTNDNKKSQDGRVYASYLVLSLGQRTMVLRTGEGMEPLEDNSGFFTSGSTLAAANLFKGQRIVQVFKQGVRVMTELEPPENEVPLTKAERDEDDEEEEVYAQLMCTQELSVEGEVDCGGMGVDSSQVGIVSVDVLDPYVLILLNDGSIRLLSGDEEDLELTASVPEISYEQGNPMASHSSISPGGIISCCLFHDWTGMFGKNAWKNDVNALEGTNKSTLSASRVEGSRKQKKKNADDTDSEDEMDAFYHSASHFASKRNTEKTNKSASSDDDVSCSSRLLKQNETEIMCGVCFEDGSLHIYSLPDFEKRGIFPYLTFAPQTLTNTLEHDHEGKKVAYEAPSLGLNASSSTANDGRIKKSHTINSPVADITIHRIGPCENSSIHYNSQVMSRMVLMVFLANGDLLLYAAYPAQNQTFTFFKVPSNLITRPFVAPKNQRNAHHHQSPTAGADDGAAAAGLRDTAAIVSKLRSGFRYPMLTRFWNVNHQSGVFFRGAHPMWLLTERGEVTLVPMCVTTAKNTTTTTSGVPVLSFTPFHHWNCPNGFIYFHSKGSLRVCELPSIRRAHVLPSSNGFVLQKTDFQTTIHNLCYLGTHGPGGVTEALESPTYLIVASTRMSPQEAEQVTDNGLSEEIDEEPTTIIGASSVVVATDMYPEMKVEEMVATEEDVYEMRLVQVNEEGEWETNGVYRVYFDRHEVVLSAKVMYLYDMTLLKDQHDLNEWNTKKRPFIVVGTGYVGKEGEDEGGRGRLLLYELDYAQYTTESGETSAKLPKLKLIYIKEHRQGAISHVVQMGHYVLAAVGSKIIVFEYKSEQLIGCAFYDAQMFIVSMSVIKDYILYGDVYKSVHFLRWNENKRALQLLAKDYEPLAVLSTEFNIYDKRLGLITCDLEENLHVLQFAPNDIESRGGQRLLRTSDFHLGAQVSSMFRKLISSTSDGEETNKVVSYVNILGSSEGSVMALVPVSERVFRRLFTLQNVMINTLPQNCALNPREFRTLKSNSTRRSGRPDGWCKQKWKKSFLDSLVLNHFLQLDYVAQKELARCIGTTPEVIIYNLLEIQKSTATFL